MANSLKEKTLAPTEEKAPLPPVLVLLAHNLRYHMDRTPALDTQQKVAAAAGIAQTSVGLMLRPEGRDRTSTKIAGPRLLELERVAKAFGLQAWQLLIDPQQLGETLAKAMSGRPVATEKIEAAGYVAVTQK